MTGNASETSKAPHIDLRSDTVTRPSAGMRAAMLAAALGDDVYGDDPTVNLLEETLAQMAGYEAAVFMPSGTQSNLVALMTHCARGEEYLVGQEAHTYRYEGGGAAVLGSIQPQPIENLADGSIDLVKLEAAIKPDDSHFAITRLIALENTIGGKVLPPGYVTTVRGVADKHGLSMHLDGARAFNAAIAGGVSIKSICRPFDSTSICLSKGLGTPVGSVLCGGRAFAERARRWRKMLGGGMRQAGVLAAAGLYALEHHVERLADDHANARRLADGLASIAGYKVSAPQTNILFVEIPESDVAVLDQHLRARGICCTLRAHTRLVTHLDVDQAAVDETIDAFKAFYA
jgi:threonine aldolase